MSADSTAMSLDLDTASSGTGAPDPVSHENFENAPSSNSTNTDRPSDRIVKKRASQACHHCRTRKVKCDLVKSGIPCHNCSSDGIECVVLESKRSRKYRLQKRQLSRVVSIPPISQAQPSEPKSISPPSASLPPPASKSRTSVGGESAKGASSSSAAAGAASILAHHFQSPSAVTPVGSIGSQGSAGGLSNRSATSPYLNLPSYIRPPRPDIRMDDVELLYRRGALKLPSPELRDQLTRSYVLYAYTYIPCVDLDEFVEAIEGKDGAPKISLLLFQAVMFAAAAFVDLPLLQEAGYPSRRAARADMYQKIKLLYDFDWDVDRIAMIQALLLMNYWYVSENDQKDPWHWVGVCISLSISIGLDQPITYTRKDVKTTRLWRRLWWSTILRDRMVAISMRRPLRIRLQDIKIPPLTLDDFETQSISPTIPALKDCVFLTHGYTRTMVAEIIIAQVNVAMLIGRIIDTFYHLRGFGGSTAEATMLYTPKRSHIDEEQYVELQHELDEWSRNLPVSCWLVMNGGDGHYDSAIEDVLLVHRSALRMIFLMASEALNRPQSLAQSEPDRERISTSKVKEAADKIAEMIRSLQERDLVRFLPPLSVSFMLLALASFLVEIKAKGQGQGQPIGELPGQQFHHCIRTLLRLREIWPIADSACFLIGQMITKNQVGRISTPGIQPSPMDDRDAPSNVWRAPEIPGGKPTPPASAVAYPPPQQQQQQQQQQSLGGPIQGVFASPVDVGSHPSLPAASSQPDMAPPPPPTPPLMTPGGGFVMPFNWASADFDPEFGVITDAHALSMDLAMPECDFLGGFGNGLLDFEPSPPNNGPSSAVGKDMASYSAISSMSAPSAPWTATVPNQYVGTAFRTHST